MHQTILPSMKAEEPSTFAQALRPLVKGNKTMNYCLQPKPWSMHRWERMPAVYMSHHPTRFKQERKPRTGLQTHAFEQSKSSSRFDFHSTVRLHCAAGRTTRTSPRHDVGSKWECTEKQEEFSKAMGKMKGFANQQDL